MPPEEATALAGLRALAGLTDSGGLNRCGSVSRHTDDLAGAGDWGRDTVSGDQPWPPPFTTIAWRMSHLSEMLAMRADCTNGSHSLTRAGTSPAAPRPAAPR